MCVGFADLSHFDRLVTTMGDEKAIEILQEALQAAGDAITRHSGRILKYIGDALLFSLADPHDAISAAREIAAYRRQAGALTLGYRVSIATGEVIVAEIGHPSYVVEDILGETVNRAAKLLRQAAQSDTGIALCEETQKYL